MNSSENIPTLEDLAVKSYIEPIRSVLFVDDKFPTYAVTGDQFDEDVRARALWEACTERGWLCDIEHSAEWTEPAQQRRLTACDLLVLDLHLSGSDSGPALRVIRGLAESDAPGLVVVYTAEPKLDETLLQLAAHARGAAKSAITADLGFEYEELEDTIEWSEDDLQAFLVGKQSWRGTYAKACRSADLEPLPKIGESIMERRIVTQFGAPAVASSQHIQNLRCGEYRWFQCGNLFVALIGKPVEQDEQSEAAALLDGLSGAVKDWAPPWMACAIARSRQLVQAGAFRDDLSLPREELQAGLLLYISSASDPAEQTRRAHRTSSYLLQRRFTNAASAMGEELLNRAKEAGQADAKSEPQLLHANAYLCSEPFHRHHLRVGTVFREANGDRYWVCVTPACDMVPRERNRSVDPWAVELDPVRPMAAIRLEVLVKKQVTEALQISERGRHLFFFDYSNLSEPKPVVVEVFNTRTGDPNPKLEQLMALNRARTATDGQVKIVRLVTDGDGDVRLEHVDCVVCCQLRAPYAERLSHVVGGHVSRIGVDFLPLPSPEAPSSPQE